MAQKKENLEKKLMIKNENGWNKVSEKEKKEIHAFANEYKQFLNTVKTEREAVRYFVDIAEKNGFKDLQGMSSVTLGSKLYMTKNQKVAAFIVTGKRPLREGIRYIISHVDSPHLDLKTNPLVEDSESSTALLKTQYYGGIKNYQWISRPLAIHGTVVTKDGKKIDLKIGESEEEPVFVIPDIEPHLARKVQGEKKLFEGFAGEDLQVLVSSVPINDEEVKAKVKIAVLNNLFESYGMREEDFQSAAIEIVPADKARDVGLDHSMIGAYGQDDRICAYTSFKAIIDLNKPEFTSIIIVYDKEETGSGGSTGAKSNFIDYVTTTLLEKFSKNYTYGDFITIMHNSKAISGDVDVLLNPLFKQVHDLTNAAKVGYGTIIAKLGSGNKFNSSEPTPEYLAYLYNLFDSKGVIYQSGSLGKVDEGGGSTNPGTTMAQDLAKYGMDVIDMGPGLLSMHSPFELVSKLDLWSTYRAFEAFLL
jgi:aspartyl aminopeptidase